MPIFTPQSIDFGIVAPGSTNSSEVVSNPFTAVEDHVTATITNDTSGDGFKVQAVKGQEVQTDGITPLTTRKGQTVVILVQFVAAARLTANAYTAKLEIHGKTWNAPVPLQALCALT